MLDGKTPRRGVSIQCQKCDATGFRGLGEGSYQCLSCGTVHHKDARGNLVAAASEAHQEDYGNPDVPNIKVEGE